MGVTQLPQGHLGGTQQQGPDLGPDAALLPLASVPYSPVSLRMCPTPVFGGLLPAPASCLVTATQEAEVEERGQCCLGGPLGGRLWQGGGPTRQRHGQRHPQWASLIVAPSWRCLARWLFL